MSGKAKPPPKKWEFSQKEFWRLSIKPGFCIDIYCNNIDSNDNDTVYNIINSYNTRYNNEDSSSSDDCSSFEEKDLSLEGEDYDNRYIAIRKRRLI